MKSENITKVEGLATLATLATKTLESAKTIQIAVIATKLNATEKLQQVAQEQGWPLSDLLDWYQKPKDMADIASMGMETVRFIVADYIKNIELNRAGGYQPPCDTPPELEPVQCADCQYFTPDSYDDGGIGDCSQNIKQRKPYWPNAERKCAVHTNLI